MEYQSEQAALKFNNRQSIEQAKRGSRFATRLRGEMSWLVSVAIVLFSEGYQSLVTMDTKRGKVELME